MVDFLIKRPIAVIMTLIAFLAIGIITTSLLPVSLLPDVDIPEINIQVSKAGLDAETMDKTIARPIRTSMAQVYNLESMDSESRNGNAIIRLRFNYGTDIDYSYLEVNEKIDKLMTSFPSDMERPNVIRARASDLPVFHLNILPKNKSESQMLDLSEFCTNVIKRRIEQLPEIAIADVSGLYKPEVVIKPNLEQLNSMGINIERLGSIISNNNIRLGNITIRDGYYQYAVTITQELNTIEDIENIYLKIADKLIQLKDIATVSIEEQELKGAYYYKNSPSIVMAIIKQSNARLYTLEDKFKSLIDQFKVDYPELDFHISQDQTKLLNVSISNLRQSLIWGGILAFIIMFFVLGDYRSPILIGISIPSSIIVSLLVFYLLGLSLNIVSLSGLILGAGMMIDNSIIVIDNITQYRQKGLRLFEACVKGTNEVIRPLISSVLTTCAVFIPLVFLSNVAGALFYDQAVAISSGLIVSLFVSILILPVLYHLINKKGELKFRTKEKESLGIRIYEIGLNKVMKRKTAYFFIFLLLIPVGYILFQNVDRQVLPTISRESFTVQIDWNERSTIEESKHRVLNIYKNLKNKNISLNAFIGEQNFVLNKDHQNTISEVSLVFEASTKELEVVQEKVKNYIQYNFPIASTNFFPTKNIFESIFETNDPPLNILLHTIDETSLPEPSDISSVYNILNQIDYAKVTDNIGLREALLISISNEVLNLYNINYNTLKQKLQTALNVYNVDKLAYNQKMIPINIGNEKKQLFEIISQTSIPNNRNEEIPLSWLINVKTIQSYKAIYGGIAGNYIPFPLEIEGKNEKKFNEDFAKALKSYDHLDYKTSGLIIKNKKMLKELIYVLAISILLLYFILAAQFESILQPFIILLEVFIDITGALFLLYLFGSSLNIMSAIGIIVMSGIIINDSILKVDTINRYKRSGMPTVKAVYEAGKRRFNPIIMTTLTTVLALCPLFFTSGLGVELQKPLALSIIGGMILGTIVSLYFIPLIYTLIYRRSDRLTGLKNR